MGYAQSVGSKTSIAVVALVILSSLVYFSVWHEAAFDFNGYLVTPPPANVTSVETDASLDFSNYAFVTLLTNTGVYVDGAIVLAVSILRDSGYFINANPPKMILLYLEDSITATDLCRLRKVGWYRQF